MATPTAGGKTLAAWRQGVPHGAFFQPIRLAVQGSRSVAAAAAPSKAPEQSAEQSAEQSNGAEAKAAVAAARNGESVVVIPPFASVHVPGEQRSVALNVGGPVWAMDWLPEPTAEGDGKDKGDSKDKGGKKRAKEPQTKANGKNAAGAGRAGKENAVENGASTQEAENEATEGSQGTNWRFLALSTHPPCDVQGGKLVRATPPDHYYDAQEAAPNLIQIWAVPVPTKAGRKRALPTPRFVYGIEHTSGVAWKIQWSPLVSEMPEEITASNPLGVLAAAFGDGSMRVFAVPQIPAERLLADKAAPDPPVIEKLRPLVTAKSSKIISLCLQWSPRRWNLILSGCSDGSIELWNIETAIGSIDNEGGAEPLEPQRCFQDADTIGKQDAFDWGNGWAAVRAICWSPFDDFVFATTGNDSLFKVWDVREPRICLRSHRIRSTWGNSIQWLADTSILISGDQGSVYLYDIVSGSYQKLHFHPQVDSPIWDIQLARHKPIPLIISGCASGSIRIAPARKLYRNPHNSVEVCRISGRKDANVHDKFKELRVNFERTTIMGTAEHTGPAIREFCERDAALHCLRLTTFKPRQFPCLLAAGGHAGLLVIMELQDLLDSFLKKHFQPSAKKMGRPKAVPMGGHNTGLKSKSNEQTKGRRGITLSRFADVKKATSKAKPKKPKRIVATVEYVSEFPRILDDDVEEQGGEVEEEEEAEFDHDGEESESEGSIDLNDDDNSDDEMISLSDDDEDMEGPHSEHQLNAEEIRMMSEYQLDLSEEDAILLAIQMSEADRDHPIDLTRLRDDVDIPSANAAKGPDKRATAKLTSVEKRAESAEAASDATAPNDVSNGEQADIGAASSSAMKPEPVADTVTAAISKRKSPGKKPAKVPRAIAASKKKKTPAHTELSAVINEPMIDQATAFQMIAYQRGLNEEEALLEAIRISEIETKQTPLRSKRSAARVRQSGQDPTMATTSPSPKRRRKEIVSPTKSGGDASALDLATNEQVAVSDKTVNASHTTASTEPNVEPDVGKSMSTTGEIAAPTKAGDANALVSATSIVKEQGVISDEAVNASPAAASTKPDDEESLPTIDTEPSAAAAAVAAAAPSARPVIPANANEAPPPPYSVNEANQASTPQSEVVGEAQGAVGANLAEESKEPAPKAPRKKAATKAKAKAKAKPRAPPAKRKASSGRPPRAPAKPAAGKAATGKRRRSGSDAMLQGAQGEFLSEEEALFMALQTSEIEF